MTYVILPWAPARLVLLTFLLAAAAARLDHGICWSGPRLARVLLGIGMAGLVVSPYWAIATTPVLRLAGLCATAGIIALWARHSGAAIRLRPAAQTWTPWFTAAGILLFCGPAVFGSLEFRGDEDVHLTRPLRFIEALGSAGDAGLPVAVTLCIALLLLVRRSRTGRLLRRGLVGLLPIWIVVVVIAHPAPETLLRLARYPSLGAGIQTVFAASPLHALPGAGALIHDEVLYRLASFGAVLLLALLTTRLVKGPVLFRTGTGLLVGTLPTLVYFSGAGYPETPAALIATSGLMGLFWRLRRGWSRGRDGTGALPSLALALLVKESLAPLVAVTTLTAALGSPNAPGSGRWKSATVMLARLAFIILTPGALYIGWRLLAERLYLSGRSMRGFGFDPSALANPAFFGILGQAWLEQFGPLLPLAAIPLLFGRRRALAALVFLVPALAQVIFLGVEFVRETPWGALPLYAGFARYQLPLVPSIICLAILGLREVQVRAPRLALAAVALGLGWNIAARPVDFTGGRKPFWGDYVQETSGERYPYDSVFAWIAGQDDGQEITVAGRDYTFRDDFYLKKHGLGVRVSAPLAVIPRSSLVLASGPDPAALLSAHEGALRNVSSAKGPVILHVSAWLPIAALPEQVGRLRMERVFCSRGHCLALYRAQPVEHALAEGRDASGSIVPPMMVAQPSATVPSDEAWECLRP